MVHALSADLLSAGNIPSVFLVESIPTSMTRPETMSDVYHSCALSDSKSDSLFPLRRALGTQARPCPAAMPILRAMVDGPVYMYGLRVVQIGAAPWVNQSGPAVPVTTRLSPKS
jgi:hypothetical protein